MSDNVPSWALLFPSRTHCVQDGVLARAIDDTVSETSGLGTVSRVMTPSRRGVGSWRLYLVATSSVLLVSKTSFDRLKLGSRGGRPALLPSRAESAFAGRDNSR